MLSQSFLFKLPEVSKSSSSLLSLVLCLSLGSFLQASEINVNCRQIGLATASEFQKIVATLNAQCLKRDSNNYPQIAVKESRDRLGVVVGMIVFGPPDLGKNYPIYYYPSKNLVEDFSSELDEITSDGINQLSGRNHGSPRNFMACVSPLRN